MRTVLSVVICAILFALFGLMRRARLRQAVRGLHRFLRAIRREEIIMTTDTP